MFEAWVALLPEVAGQLKTTLPGRSTVSVGTSLPEKILPDSNPKRQHRAAAAESETWSGGRSRSSHHRSLSREENELFSSYSVSALVLKPSFCHKVFKAGMLRVVSSTILVITTSRNQYLFSIHVSSWVRFSTRLSARGAYGLLKPGGSRHALPLQVPPRGTPRPAQPPTLRPKSWMILLWLRSSTRIRLRSPAS